MPIVCRDVFAATTAPVSIPGLEYPAVVTAGVSIQRFAIYNDTLYAEYIWMRNTATEFTPAAPIDNVDVYAIAQGKTGAAGNATSAGAGGMAGGVGLTKGYTLLAAKYICYFTESSTIFYNPGGQNVVYASSSGFTGTYYLYGDTNYPVGTTLSPLPGTEFVPGKGANGCTFIPNMRAASTLYPSSETEVAISEGAIGIGAGGTGGARTDLQVNAMAGLTGAGLGGRAMIMLRIPIPR